MANLVGKGVALSMLRRMLTFVFALLLVASTINVVQARQDHFSRSKGPEIRLQVSPANARLGAKTINKGAKTSLYGYYPYYIQRYFNYSAGSYTVYFHVGKGSWAHEITQLGGYTYQWEGYYCSYDGGCDITMTYSGFGTLYSQRVYGNLSLYYR